VHVGRKQRQVRIGAPVQRQLDDLRRVDHLPLLAGIGIDQRCRAAHFHFLRGGAHLHRHVHALPRVHVHRHIVGGGLVESRVLHGDRVTAHLHVEEIEIAILARDDLRLQARRLAGQHDGRMGDYRPARVVHRAQHFRRFKLREQRRGDRET
jgi:hypothetical protein